MRTLQAIVRHCQCMIGLGFGKPCNSSVERVYGLFLLFVCDANISPLASPLSVKFDTGSRYVWHEELMTHFSISWKYLPIFIETVASGANVRQMSALLQLHLHSRLNTWLLWIEQRQIHGEIRSRTYVLPGIPLPCLHKIRGPVNSRTNGQKRGKCFHLMTSSCFRNVANRQTDRQTDKQTDNDENITFAIAEVKRSKFVAMDATKWHSCR